MLGLAGFLILLTQASQATELWKPNRGPNRDVLTARLHLTPLDGLGWLWAMFPDFHPLQCLLSHPHVIIEVGPYNGTELMPGQLTSLTYYRTLEYHPYMPEKLRNLAEILLRPSAERFKEPDSIGRLLKALPHALWTIMTPTVASDMMEYLFGKGHVDYTDSPGWTPVHRQGRLSKTVDANLRDKGISLASIDDFNIQWGDAYHVGNRNCHAYSAALLTNITSTNFHRYFLTDTISTSKLLLLLLFAFIAVSTIAIRLLTQCIERAILPRGSASGGVMPSAYGARIPAGSDDDSDTFREMKGGKGVYVTGHGYPLAVARRGTAGRRVTAV